MANIDDMNDLFLGYYDADIIDNDDLMLLHDMHRRRNSHLPYWNYERFSLELMEEDECKAEFRVNRSDIINQAPRGFLKVGGGGLKSSGLRKNSGLRACPRTIFKPRPLNSQRNGYLEDMPCKILHLMLVFRNSNHRLKKTDHVTCL